MEADERAGDADQRARRVAVSRYELPAQPGLAIPIEDEPGSDADREHDKEICDAGTALPRRPLEVKPSAMRTLGCG